MEGLRVFSYNGHHQEDKGRSDDGGNEWSASHSAPGPVGAQW